MSSYSRDEPAERTRERSRERAPDGGSEEGKLFVGNLSFDVR